MPTLYCVGIDGGGTGTRAAAALEPGKILRRTAAGPSNPHNSSPEDAAHAIAASLRALDLPPASIAAICAGIAGLGSPEVIQSLENALRRALPEFAHIPLLLTHDLETAWQGAFGGADGLCLISGTGSACYARLASGPSKRVSGRADGRDDPGSAYAIAREAIAQGLLPPQTPPRPHTPVGVPASAGLPPERAAIAALAPAVLALPQAAPILAAQARALAAMAIEALLLFPPNSHPPIAFMGGFITSSPSFQHHVAAAIRQSRPDATCTSPQADALHGALALAFQKRKTPGS